MPSMLSVDLNCDMGEGYPNDAALMDYVSSVNIACGFHAGDDATMRTTVKAAIEKGVAIGAHPSYPDRENFGRTAMSLAPDEIREIVTEQIQILQAVCDADGGKLSHVKPHGALYNHSAKDPAIAAAIAQAVRDHDPKLILFGLSGSVSIGEAQTIGLQTASEAFADRTYRSDGSLTPRSEANALIIDTVVAAEQAFRMISNGCVIAAGGELVAIDADTICIHGDGEHALDFAAAIHKKLTENGIRIKAFNG